MNELIEVKDVSFGYDGQPVFSDINITVYKGDYVGIVGPNGSGKSTLIKIMLNILKPSRGSVKIMGRDIDRFRAWEQVGYVRQKATAFNARFPATVEEIVSANLYPQIGLFKSIRPVHKEQVYKTLKIVKMDGYGKRLIGNLSGGQQQRVFIARALVNSPKILFLDEPTVGIDLDSQRKFYDLMEKLNNKFNISIVMVSHDVEVITKKVNRIVYMGDGRLKGV